MSELSAEEKKRILRERRQAKMAKGQASERLNAILSSGSSVKENTVKSVLDEPKETEVGDPEIQDINTVRTLPQQTQQGPDPSDMDKMFQSIFSGGEPNEQLSEMMKMFNNTSAEAPQDTQDPEDAEELQYQAQLAAYNAYIQRKWKFRFLVARYTILFVSFWYFFATPGFQASAESYVRGNPATHSFMNFFLTFELVSLSTYYVFAYSKGYWQNASQDSIIFKAVDLGSMVLPALASYRPLVATLLRYYELFNMLSSDVSLVIILLGLFSYLG